jgi:hypothetical protein
LTIARAYSLRKAPNSNAAAAELPLQHLPDYSLLSHGWSFAICAMMASTFLAVPSPTNPVVLINNVAMEEDGWLSREMGG